MIRLAAWLALGFAMMPTGLTAAPRLAVLPFEIIDATQDANAMALGYGGGLPKGPNADEARRLTIISQDLVRRIEADGRYELVQLAAVLPDIEAKGPIHKCNGCEDDIAKKVAAQLVMIATVEKLSDLLFNFNLYLRDVTAQKITAVMSTTVQGSTDEAWLRGIRYLAERKLLTPGDKK